MKLNQNFSNNMNKDVFKNFTDLKRKVRKLVKNCKMIIIKVKVLN